MGRVTKLGPGRCRFILPERSLLAQSTTLLFERLLHWKTSVPFVCRFVACRSRIKVRKTDRQTDRHTDGQTKYRNPRCACAPRVKKACNTVNVYYAHNLTCVYTRELWTCPLPVLSDNYKEVPMREKSCLSCICWCITSLSSLLHSSDKRSSLQMLCLQCTCVLFSP